MIFQWVMKLFILAAFFYSSISFAVETAASSTKLAPTVSTPVLKNQKPTLEMPAAPTDNSGFSTLFYCRLPDGRPDDPPPICKDINGKLPAGMNERCPDYCVQQRYVSYYDGFGGAFTSNTSREERIYRVIPATCPDGYMTVSIPEVGDEYRYSVDPPEIGPPISEVMYNNNIQQGTCHAVLPRKFTIACSPASLFSVGMHTSFPHIFGGNIVYITDRTSAGYYTNKDGIIFFDKCGFTDANQNSQNSGITYMDIKCKPQPGFYKTGKTVPQTIICGRIKPKWQ